MPRAFAHMFSAWLLLSVRGLSITSSGVYPTAPPGLRLSHSTLHSPPLDTHPGTLDCVHMFPALDFALWGERPASLSFVCYLPNVPTSYLVRDGDSTCALPEDGNARIRVQQASPSTPQSHLHFEWFLPSPRGCRRTPLAHGSTTAATEAWLFQV